MTMIAKGIAICGVVAGLGIAGIPMGIYAADTAQLTISATIGDYIAVEAEPSTVNIGNVMQNGAVAEAGTDIGIKSNNGSYNVTVKADGENGTKMKTDKGEFIETGIPEANATTSAWGYKVSSDELTITKQGYQAASSEGEVVASREGNGTSGGETLHLDFGVAADETQAEGIYKGSVTVTVTSQLSNQTTP